ncbi:MAG: hypothetical protein ACM3QW_03665 [Ignavibacteriales bacterium]
MSIRCKSCGQTMDNNSLFCDQCGSKLAPNSQPPLVKSEPTITKKGPSSSKSDITVLRMDPSSPKNEPMIIKKDPGGINHEPTVIYKQTESNDAKSAGPVVYKFPSAPAISGKAADTSNKKRLISAALVFLLATASAYVWYCNAIDEANTSKERASKVTSSQYDDNQSVVPSLPAGTMKASEVKVTTIPKPAAPSAAKPTVAKTTKKPVSSNTTAVKTKTTAKKATAASSTKTTFSQLAAAKQAVSRSYLEYLVATTKAAPNQAKKRAAFRSNVAKLGHVQYKYYVVDGRGTLAQAKQEMRLFLTQTEGSGSPLVNQEISWGVSTVH